ncbi:MAG TPA: cation:proton antiporter subunit C [Firmicutes bacterium]|jgi:multicomponent Na+:H+ antiporter subunit C|nr:cation:proton antiporter subunit C [Bacillota bacterium]
MEIDFSKLLLNYPYFIAMIIFCLGCLCTLTQHNLLKKVIGLNIMQSGIFLFYIAVGNIKGGIAPIYDPTLPEGTLYINPLPSTLILTGIVVGFSVTAFALALIVKLYNYYGTIYAPKIIRMR